MYVSGVTLPALTQRLAKKMPKQGIVVSVRSLKRTRLLVSSAKNRQKMGKNMGKGARPSLIRSCCFFWHNI